MGLSLPKPTKVVTYLLVINIAIFVLITVSSVLREALCHVGMMAVWATPLTGGGILGGQIWRLVTYQYLHATDSAFHLFFNMLGLYFLGPPLEARWGPKTFFIFYTACGVAGGILFTLLVLVGFIPAGTMVGASGSVLGLLAACAVLMPQMIIILLFFPVPIRLAALLLVAVYVLNLLAAFGSGHAGAGGDAAHLGGMAFGAAWCLWGWSWLQRRRETHHQGAWERKMRRQEQLQAEVDRILAKVHEQGIQSLTRREKQILAEATDAQRKSEQRSRRL
jgi:membrane associated rhomboid family serine protease